LTFSIEKFDITKGCLRPKTLKNPLKKPPKNLNSPKEKFDITKGCLDLQS